MGKKHLDAKSWFSGDRMDEEIQEKIKEASEGIEDVVNDTDVPRNIRDKLKEVKEKINNEESEKKLGVRLSRSMYLLNEASEDINIPFHARTDIMNITSILEEVKEEVK